MCSTCYYWTEHIKAESNSSTPAAAEEPLWSRSNNVFRFNFFPDSSPAASEKAPASDRTEPTSQISFTEQGSAFAFNFQIPPAEDMDTTDTPNTSQGDQQCVPEEKPPLSQEVESPPEQSEQSKTKKKKKKSGKKNSSSIEPLQKPAEESEGAAEELGQEEQLKRELDWCIEQLELGLKCQKGTPKQKDEASRALKTLRSSKAPLPKKRQVMRAVTGDYRKKMEEEKTKQFKLIQSEIASAQVKLVSESPKKSVFHRRAEDKTQTSLAEEKLRRTEAHCAELTPQTQEATPVFVLIPSKEEFHFNFL
ncbi:UPF0488 protein C8orf33 homolog isoform X1 [Pundamilia nyererei]|uniref:UPF0488 protein C8orf33 homolog isoform X1 n=1 Tax=Pundamilia nyererei TaxID=303518 RepID=A0A9Y3SBA5_9CICH|nr:PREDICTED: UPF0488 protein C8orf33 homolog isoform X1 [Pundamilia nyererei]